GDSLRLDLDFLALTLRDAGICSDLAEAVAALRGPVVDRRALAKEREAAWAALWQSAADEFKSQPVLQVWLQKLARLGLLRRLCNDEPDAAAALLKDIARTAHALPADAEPLASFAARLFGDAHALDPGTPRATLAVRAAARLGGIHFTD